VNTPASVREHVGKHRTEVTEGGGWLTNAIGGRSGLPSGTGVAGKHRTEVTEVTEGESWLTNAIGGHSGLPSGTGVVGKHRTEVTEVTEGGGLVDECDWWTLGASVREQEYREASHRGHGGHRGGGWLRGDRVTLLASVREAAHAERRGEEIALANLYKFNRIRTSLCGFAHQKDPNRK
jgi:hypothetical protein